MEKKATAMIQNLSKVLATHEDRIPSIRKVKNLSRSDLETAILYAETIQKRGTWEGELMPPRCNVKDLLAAFGLLA